MAENGTRTSLGVLVSTDHGEHWKPYGRLTDRRTMLLEPTVVELKPSSHHPRGSVRPSATKPRFTRRACNPRYGLES
jgi:hypothetical protein